MHRFIVNVRADALRNVESIILRFRALAEMLLFIADIVLGARHHTSILNTLDGGSNQGTCQIWIR